MSLIERLRPILKKYQTTKAELMVLRKRKKEVETNLHQLRRSILSACQFEIDAADIKEIGKIAVGGQRLK